MAFMAAIAVLGVAFYSWFLVVLCREYKGRRSGYFMRLEQGTDDPRIAVLPSRNETEVRAA